VEEALPALQQAHAAQRDQVRSGGGMAEIVTKTRDFFTEVVDELKKVTWPDWPQLKNATLVILVFVLIVAAIIWVMDLGVRGVLGVIMDVFAR
jgi:preprotein translocase subunit SecE